MATLFDFKKEFKALYQPPTKPQLIDVPEMVFIMVDGKGDPNTSTEYQDAMALLFGLSYGIKMSKKNATVPEGYFDFVVCPLEGFWWGEEGLFDGTSIQDKDKFCWTAMIRQPEFVTPEVFASTQQTLARKKPELDVSLARLVKLTEGLCAQIMHIGSYDDEPQSIELLERFIIASGYRNDISDSRRHHEIYLGDPRKTAPEKRKTVIRHPIA